MGLTITNKGGDYESLDAGRYKAICYKIVDAGTRAESYKGGKPKPRTLVYLYWEVTHVQIGDDGDEFWDEIRMEDGRRFSMSKKYTASMNEGATLFQELKSWRGRKFTDEEIAGFDITKLLGKTCEFDVVTYQKTDGSSGTAVEGIYKPEGGVKAEETENEQTVFDLDVYAKEFTGESDEESKRMCDVWDDLPDWLKEMIEESFEIKAAREKGGKKDDYRPAAGGLSDFQKDQPDEDEVPF
tara:strand:+ start:7265 stop:7987 length:723 start_codon:yes stop_codon:yes gene_type:complete